MSEAINNFVQLSNLIPETFDGDTFYYTEILNRSRRAGNNKARRSLTFNHRYRGELFDQQKDIIEECEKNGSRAYLRVRPRSFKAVGAAFLKFVVEEYVSGNVEGMRHAYSRVCGITPSSTDKLWLLDIDGATAEFIREQFKLNLGAELAPDTRQHDAPPTIRELVPTKNGYHVLLKPFNMHRYTLPLGWEVHKDNPTCLYIPSNDNKITAPRNDKSPQVGSL